MMYEVYECVNIYHDDFFGPHDVWTKRGGFTKFESAKDFADQLICDELRGPEYEGALVYHHDEVYGEERRHVMFGATLAFKPLPYGSRGIFVVKAP